MENQQRVISPYDKRTKATNKRMPVEHIDGGPVGVTILDLPHNGCRHVHGGSGNGLKLCGRQATKDGLTYLYFEHKGSYGRPGGRA